MKNVFVIVFALTAFSVFAQTSKPEAYAKTISAADLKKRLYIVAGADMQGSRNCNRGPT